jgi:peptidoglycan DL-endopeptidase CwlO
VSAEPADTASVATSQSSAASRSASRAVTVALAQVGKPYRWGGSGPNSFDCSGLTSFAWRRAGEALPHSSRRQYGVTTRVSRSNLRPGDLVFFYSPISHVAMYVGDGKVVEAPGRGRHVRVASLKRSGYAGAGRP